jgi:hypothetical protein
MTLGIVQTKSKNTRMYLLEADRKKAARASDG